MNKISVFVSYSHEDIKYIDKFKESLADNKNIELWTDEHIKVGDKFNKKIYNQIKKSDIIIFFISMNLMNRSYSYVKDIEIPLALIENRRRNIQLIALLIDKDSYNTIYYQGLKENFTTIPEDNKQPKSINEFEKKKFWQLLNKDTNPWDVVQENLNELILSNDFKNYLQNRQDEYIDNIAMAIKEKEGFDKSIPRDVEADIYAWFKSDKSACYLQGDEGVGKTFLALQFAKKIQADEIIAFYHKSIEWNSCKTIQEILVLSFGFAKEDEITNINEFLNGFEKPILIILDGVNEKGALEVVDNILNDYFKESLYQKKIKLIFTTRDLSNYTNFSKSLWTGLTKIPVNKYNQAELKDAISKFEPDFDFEQFPKNLITIASKARLLKLVLKLKDKLGAYENVTVEILYWEGLKEQIENDSSVRTDLSITSKNIERVLCKFIDNCTIENSLIKTDDTKLASIFGKNFLNIENSLKEISLIEYVDTDSTITLNPNHIVIAYSIYLLNKFKDIDNTLEIEEIADRFKFYLEPYDNDFISNVPFMVFQLSLERNEANDNISKLHSGLLYLWLNNHNSNIYSENLQFWCKYDLKSIIDILDIVEFKYKDFNRNKLQEIMLAVLCEVWHESNGQHKELKSYLKSIFLSTITYKHNQHIAKIKRSIIILGRLPTEEFLDIFIDLIDKIKNSEDEDKTYTLHILNEKLSTLFRFGYEEEVFEKLETKDEYKGFAKLYKSYSLSEKLSLALEPVSLNNHIVSFVEKVSRSQELLNEFTMDDFNLYTIEGLENLACRRDLKLDKKDKNKIIKTLEHLSKNFEKKERGGRYKVDWIYDSFPYLLASFDVKSFNDINSRFLFQTIKQKAYPTEVDRFNLTILPNDEFTKFIVSNMKNLLEFEHENHRVRFINQLIEVMLFTANETQLESFFNYLIDELKFSNILLHNHPVDYYIRELFGNELKSIIYDKLNEQNIEDDKYDCLMLYLYILHDFENSFLIDWAVKKLKNGLDKENNEYKNILANTTPNEYFEKLYNGELKEILYNPNSSGQGEYISYWITREDNFYHDKTFEELIEILPADSIGNLLIHNKRYEDINKWGKYIFENIDTPFINELDVKEAIAKYCEQNNDDFKKYAIEYLTKINDSKNRYGKYFLSFRTFEDTLIKLLIPLEFEKAKYFYNKTKESSYILNGFVNEIFKVKKYNTPIYKEYRKNYINTLKNDIEILHIVRAIFGNESEDELIKFIEEWLNSIYAKERLLAVSLLTWFGDDYSIEKLEYIKGNDDSEYVRYFARWAFEVSNQEKYAKVIYEEILKENNYQIISAKLHQIKSVITPMVNHWVVKLNDKYELYTDKTDKYKKVLIQRFWNMVSETIKDDKKIEINKRKLFEYYRGEEITDANRFITGDFK